MNAKRRGLGKGLSALLGESAGSANAPTSEPEGTYRELAVDLLQPGKYQPRSGMDEAKLTELADSIAAQGMVQPIVVRSVGAGKYEIIAGERRWRAALLAVLAELTVLVREVSVSENRILRAKAQLTRNMADRSVLLGIIEKGSVMRKPRAKTNAA